MPDILSANDFFNVPGIILDTRSPGEYAQGHIPGAVSFPLFTNEERAQVGTYYKQQGKDAAIELGLSIVAPKIVEFVRSAKRLSPERRVRVYCWRGGMRSSSMGWLLETAGFDVMLLEGGYKGFRRWIRSTLATPRKIVILGGMTGTGKTKMLHALAEQGEQILDLEALANHRGSSYGALGLPAQPTNEQFENLVAMQWRQIHLDRPVWIEAESRRVGLCRIPDEIFVPMMQAPVVQIERSRQERIEILLEIYGSANPEGLIDATQRISRKLGGQNAKQAIEDFRQGNLVAAIEIVLNYYDKAYLYDLQRRNVLIHTVEMTGLSMQASANQLIEKAKQIFGENSASVTHELVIQR